MKVSLIDSLLLGTGAPTETHPIRAFLESKGSVERFSSHFRRTSNRLLRRYMEHVNAMLDSYSSHPTDAGLSLLSSVARDCNVLLESSQSGDKNKVSYLLPQAYSKANEYSSMMAGFGPSGLGVTGTMVEDESYSDEHTSFCRKFCKEFKVKESRHESVAEGVFIYFDAESTEALQKIQHFALSEFCFENGYIMLKAGSVDDFAFGSFGENLSKWSFVYLPEDE